MLPSFASVHRCDDKYKAQLHVVVTTQLISLKHSDDLQATCCRKKFKSHLVVWSQYNWFCFGFKHSNSKMRYGNKAASL